MNVQDLISELQQFDPGSEVRFASQPSWPFEYSISAVITIEPEFNPDDPDFDPDRFDAQESVVYLAEGSQLGYLPREVKDELGW